MGVCLLFDILGSHLELQVYLMVFVVDFGSVLNVPGKELHFGKSFMNCDDMPVHNIDMLRWTWFAMHILSIKTDIPSSSYLLAVDNVFCPWLHPNC